MNKTSYLSIRSDKPVHDKLQYIASYEGRSMSVPVGAFPVPAGHIQ